MRSYKVENEPKRIYIEVEGRIDLEPIYQEAKGKLAVCEDIQLLEEQFLPYKTISEGICKEKPFKLVMILNEAVYIECEHKKTLNILEEVIAEGELRRRF